MKGIILKEKLGKNVNSLRVEKDICLCLDRGRSNRMGMLEIGKNTEQSSKFSGKEKNTATSVPTCGCCQIWQ